MHRPAKSASRAPGQPFNNRSALSATHTTVGNGNQALRDIPQSITVVTEKLIGDRDVRYERMEQAMAMAQHSGLNKFGFVTQPGTP